MEKPLEWVRKLGFLPAAVLAIGLAASIASYFTTAVMENQRLAETQAEIQTAYAHEISHLAGDCLHQVVAVAAVFGSGKNYSGARFDQAVKVMAGKESCFEALGWAPLAAPLGNDSQIQQRVGAPTTAPNDESAQTPPAITILDRLTATYLYEYAPTWLNKGESLKRFTHNSASPRDLTKPGEIVFLGTSGAGNGAGPDAAHILIGVPVRASKLEGLDSTGNQRDGSDIQGFFIGILSTTRLLADSLIPITDHYALATDVPDRQMHAIAEPTLTGPMQDLGPNALSDPQYIRIANAYWRLSFGESASALPSPATALQIILPLAILLGSLLLARILYMRMQAAHDRQKIESLKNEFTGEIHSLKESNNRFNSIFEAIPLSLYVTGHDNKVSLLNTASAKQRRKRRDDLIGESLLDLFPEDIREECGSAIEDLKESRGTFEKRYEIKTREGEIQALHSLSRPLIEDGRFDGVVTLVRDWTEWRRVSRELEANEIRLQSILRNAADGIVTTDEQGCIETWNDAAAKLFGYAESEVIGNNFAELVELINPQNPGEDSSQQFESFIDDMLGRGPVQLNAKTRNNVTIPLDFTLSEMVLTRSRHFILVTRDVRDRVEIQQQLTQARKMESIGQLTGGIAHDFNNLLMVVHGSLQLVLKMMDDDDGKLTSKLKRALDATTRGSELTRQLLAFARKQTLEPEVVDVSGLIERLQRLLEYAIDGNVSVIVKTDSEVGLAFVDAGQLENALLNLSINARDAMPRGGQLTIQTAMAQLPMRQSDDKSATNTPYAVVSVTDTGVGIPAEHLEHIFEPFFTTKETGQGTGLGLSTVHGFAKQSGGEVTVESREGHGTTFKLYLPLAPKGMMPASAEEVVMDQPHDEFNGLNVLIVEDDQDVRETANDLFESMGFQTFVAEDGRSGLNFLETTSEKIHLVFTDIVMPGEMDGAEMGDAINKLWPGLPIIYTSGFPRDALTQKGILRDSVTLLRKPYNLNQLQVSVQEILSRSQLKAATG